MTAPGNDAALITLLATFTACAGYAAGRLHQWYRTGEDRDEAYRDGYDTATRSVFSTAARLIAPRRAARGTAAVVPSAPPPAGFTSPSAGGGSFASPSAEGGPGGKHLVPDELVQAPTYRLAPDRVARAKVHGSGQAPDAAQARPPSVPRPRSS